MDLEKEVTRQMKILMSGTAEVIPEEELREKIRDSISNKKPLRVKLGIDPTSPHVHLGHMVVYGKMRQFQDLGHQAVLLIGDYTARIGDPTGRNIERPPLTKEQVRENSRTYREQIFKIVDKEKTEVYFQSSGFDSVTLQDILTTASAFSTAQMLTHETFRSRLEKGQRLSLHELFYPVLQAWDSLLIKADVELGGTDQKFNILCGRDLQRSHGMAPQAALFMPILEGTDGRKMSKSFGNHIPVEASPEEMFGKIMSIGDDLIKTYFTLILGWNDDKLKQLDERFKSENPRDIKLDLAREIVRIYHSDDAALSSRESFLNQFSRKKVPDDIPLYKCEDSHPLITTVLKDSGLFSSISEARRLIIQGGLKIDGTPLVDPGARLDLSEHRIPILKAGKRKYLKVSRNT